MRMSDVRMAYSSLNTIHSSNAKYDNLLVKMSSGQKIQKAYEDPFLAQKTSSFRDNINKNNQYDKNVRDAQAHVDFTESVLSRVSDALVRVKELMVQASNEIIVDESRSAIMKEVDEIIEEMTNLANQSFGGKYIFAGTATTERPFELVGKPATDITYHGNGETTSIMVDDTYNMEINIPGNTSFEGIIKDLIATRDLIDQKDTVGVGNYIDNINKNMDAVVSIRTELGAKSNILTNLKEKLDTSTFELKSTQSNLMDVDYAQSASLLATMQVGFQASFSVIGKIQEMSLLNYIR